MQKTLRAKAAVLLPVLLLLGAWVAPRAFASGPPPVITAQPTNTTVQLLGTVTFSVTASSGSTMTYQWMQDGHNISGATLAAYTISNVTATDAATYSVKVTNAGGYVTSSNATLTIVYPAPTALTQAASSVSSTSAVFNATVNFQGAPGKYFFRYGATTSYGAFSKTNSLSGKTGDINVSASQSGLLPGTPYHCQIVVITSGRIAIGEDVTFTTFPGAPRGSDLSASDVTPTSAVLNGSANQQLLGLTCHFQYGTDTSYGQVSGNASVPPLGGLLSGTAAVAIPISGLTPGTIYHYRLVISGLTGTTYGQDASFVSDVVSSNLTVAPAPAGFDPVSGFSCELLVPPGIAYVVEATGDLQHWTPIFTNISSSATAVFTDSAAVNFHKRMYRLVVRQ